MRKFIPSHSGLVGAVSVLAIALAGCTSTPKLSVGGSKGYYAKNGKTSGPEFFSSKLLGVGASPRVASGKRMPRGGGRDQVGKPYTVQGKTYYPTENPDPVQTGRASWYGAAFHGRLTANGEVYDMNHLTAAHKTMPLPSYARVTNLDNGRSVMVRVNDRGPFADDRVIDLSKRAADLLDYSEQGTARVKVEYAGRAPLDGNDDSFLLASVRGIPGYPAADRFGTPATGVAIAMSGPTPTAGVRRPATGLPGVETDRLTTGGTKVASADPAPVRASHFDPKRIPLPVERPDNGLAGVAVSAYADMRVSSAFSGFDLEPAARVWKAAY